MANSLVAVGLEQLSSAFVAGLWDGGTLLPTIWRDGESDLTAGKGDTVTVRSPQVIAAVDFTGTASATETAEGKIAVAVDQQPYSQVALTAKEQALAIEELATQVIQPQVGGVAEFIDAAIATKIETTTGTSGGAAMSGWREAVADAYGVLSTNKVPLGNRWLALAPDVAALMLSDTVFVGANTRADGGDALNNAVLGSLYGFQVFASPFITAGEAYAYHGTAVAGVFRTPPAPQGGATSGSASYNGVSAQMIFDYDSAKLSDVLTCHTLFGLGSSDKDFNKRVVEVTIA